MSSVETHWRDSARRTRFFMLDSAAILPIFIFVLHIRLWTFILALILITFFWILERFKFTIPVFFRWLRSTLAGPLRIAKPFWRT